MGQMTERYYKEDFWAVENLKYSEPHFRLKKAARIINGLVGKKECDLLDVGCGPAALEKVLARNIRYHGIDIAIQKSAPNLLQADFVKTPVRFGNKKFDIIIAQGVFEYVGCCQMRKLAEIKGLLRPNGRFLASYVNFSHVHKYIYAPYNNIQTHDEFRKCMSRVFQIERVIPTSLHLHHHEPTREWMKAIQMHVNADIPLISRLFAVEHFFVCSLKKDEVPGED